MAIAAIKFGALGALLALPLAFAAGAWIGAPSRPPRASPVVKVLVEPRPTDRDAGDNAGPQFDSGDPRFIIDPDGSDDQSRDRSCDTTSDDCDSGPDDPDQAVIKT
jgi:hypothetical protein